MTFTIGKIFSDLFRPVETPPRLEVELIEGGPNAPFLAQRPKDYVAGAIGQNGGWEAETKIDGIRCLHIDGRLVTLEGQPMNCARHCLPALAEIEKHFGCGPMFFDGEYVEEEGFEATQKAYAKGEGQGVLWLFDAVPMEKWRTDSCPSTRRQRKAQLGMNYLAAPSPWVGLLESFTIHDDVMAGQLFQRVRKHHHEGIVLKRADSLYRRARNDDWLRMKPCETVDMKLTDIEGNDKAGARRLVCRDPGTGRPVILTTGFAAERHLLWTNRDLFLGSDDTPGVLVEVAFNGRTIKGQPRHARFSKLRQDKLPPLHTREEI